MLGLPPSVPIYFATEFTARRNGVERLGAIVDGSLHFDPLEGHLPVFVGTSKDEVMTLFWDSSVYVPYL